MVPPAPPNAAGEVIPWLLGETVLAKAANVGLYNRCVPPTARTRRLHAVADPAAGCTCPGRSCDSDEKTDYNDGEAMVTTHRLFWLGRVILAVDLVRIVSVTEAVRRAGRRRLQRRRRLTSAAPWRGSVRA